MLNIEDDMLVSTILQDCDVDLLDLGIETSAMSDAQRAGVLVFISLDQERWQLPPECCRLVRLIVSGAGVLRNQWYPLARRFPRSYVALLCAMADAHSSCYEPARLGTMGDLLYNYVVMALTNAPDPVSRRAELLRSVWINRPEGHIAREYLQRWEPTP